MPVVYLKLVLQAVKEVNLSPETLLAGTALDAEQLLRSDRPVDFDDTLSVLRNAERKFGPGWHLEVGERLTISTHGPLGFAVVTAPNLRASLEVILRFMGTRAPFLWSSGTVEDDQYVFRFFDAVEMGDQRRTLIELAVLSLQGLIEKPLGREISGATLSLAYDPPVYSAALRRLFHADTVFGADRHSLRLPLAWLEEHCALYDEAMHRYLVSRCEDELQATSAGLPAKVAVRQALLVQPGRMPSLEAVAALQYVSPRTLIRRLKGEGTSFQQIRDEVRQSLSRDYLSNTNMSITRIALRLGYQDASNFSRAFRRWEGVSPRTYRCAKARRYNAA